MRPFLPTAIVLGLVVAVQGLGWLAPPNDALRDLRFASDEQPTSEAFAFIDVDPKSLEAVGVWPWPRRIHAEVLTRLLDLGADTVAFDIDFSTASNPEDDAIFERALADAGGYAVLAGFRQLDAYGGDLGFTLPLDRFARYADLAFVNVATDSTGTVRKAPIAIPLNSNLIPSLPVMLAGVPVRVDRREFVIDYAVDPATIPRISVAKLLDGSVDPALIAGRKVVVGASALELRDVMMTPKHGALPGAMIQLMAAESVRQGRMLLAPQLAETLALFAVLAILLVALGPALATVPGLAAAIGGAILLEAVAFRLQAVEGILLDTAGPQLALVLCVGMALALEAFEKRRLLREAARQRTEALERLAHLAIYDPLTDALTRQGFIERLADLERDGRPIALITIGLDRFERINGALGYAVGDLVLKEIAGRLGQLQPAALGRIASENFAVALRDTGIPVAALARTMMAALQSPMRVAGHEVMVSCHAGHLLWRPETDDIEPAALIRRVEIAKSLAASSARVPELGFEGSMEERVTASRRLELALRDAIRNGHLGVGVQGQFDLETGRLVGGEALARWQDAQLGAVSPAQFVPLAEDTGLAVPLGAQIMMRACGRAKRLPSGCRIAVNVSPTQFELDDIPALVAQALEASDLSPDRLDIEITESVLLAATDSIIKSLHKIRDLGVGIALDDFGTGFSSLAYLTSMPITKLKIDQSFVRELPGDTRSATVVAAILDLSRKLGLTVVAEGIETEEQAKWLRRNGCDIGQGYFFHRPELIDDFIGTANRLLAVEAPRLSA